MKKNQKKMQEVFRELSEDSQRYLLSMADIAKISQDAERKRKPAKV